MNNYIGAATAVASAAIGFWAGIIWCDAMLETIKATHKREMDEIFEEIKRCRAQVADMIGNK